MTRLELTDEESEVLTHVLESYLGELRTEISHTDSSEFREGLRRRAEVIRKTLAALRGDAETKTAP